LRDGRDKSELEGEGGGMGRLVRLWGGDRRPVEEEFGVVVPPEGELGGLLTSSEMD